MAEMNKHASRLIAAFVLLLIGAILISTAASSSNEVTDPTGVYGETLTITSARLPGNEINQSVNFTLTNAGLAEPGGWVDNSVVIANASGFIISSTNYTVSYTSDRISFLNTTYMKSGGGFGNTTLVTYAYYPNSYVTQSWARTAIDTNIGLIAIGIMLVGVGLFYQTARDMDWF